MDDRARIRLGDKELLIIVGLGIVLILILLYLRGRQAATQQALNPVTFPGSNPYGWAIPGFPPPVTPPVPAPGNIDVNVTGTPYSTLSPYMPLFGFVGVDATSQFQ
jgi:hypothetical protein